MAVKKTVVESSVDKKPATRKIKAESTSPELKVSPEALDPTASDKSSPTVSLKHTRKLAKEAEKELKKELQRYKSALKKASDRPGYRQVLADREKIKKAEWMLESVKHFLKDSDKKSAKSAPPAPTYHQQIVDSIEDVKAARRRLKPSTKSAEPIPNGIVASTDSVEHAEEVHATAQSPDPPPAPPAAKASKPRRGRVAAKAAQS